MRVSDGKFADVATVGIMAGDVDIVDMIREKIL